MEAFHRSGILRQVSEVVRALYHARLSEFCFDRSCQTNPAISNQSIHKTPVKVSRQQMTNIYSAPQLSSDSSLYFWENLVGHYLLVARELLRAELNCLADSQADMIIENNSLHKFPLDELWLNKAISRASIQTAVSRSFIIVRKTKSSN